VIGTGHNNLLPPQWTDTATRWESVNGHPRIVKLIDHFQEGDHVYLVTEKLHGPVTNILRHSSAPWHEKDACRVITQVLEGLAHLHSKNISYADLTPANILSVDDKISSVKLAGFTKSFVGENNSDILCDSTFKAPEVLDRAKHGTPGDIWTLGCFTYLLLSGKRAFQDKNMLKQTTNIKNGTYELPDADWGSVSAKAKEFIASLLKVDPSKRPTASDALKHEWITGGGSDVELKHFTTNLKATK